MLSGSCGTRDEPYIPRLRADASVLKRGLSWGHLLNIYKLKTTSCGLFCIRKPCPGICVRSGMQFPLTAPLGNSIPLRTQIPGRIFHQSPQPETTSHSKGEFWDALSETPSIRKVRPTLNTSSERMRTCQEKSLENLEAFTFVRLNARHRERRSTRPKRPFWRLQPCYPDLPWWGDPLRRPSYRAAS